uniref:Uncharacterized protein n=1 Tax=viral metagenome TaxID=1070528 RepID=A0A6M3ID91_9ZZZZ
MSSYPVIPQIRSDRDVKLALDNIRAYFKRKLDEDNAPLAAAVASTTQLALNDIDLSSADLTLANNTTLQYLEVATGHAANAIIAPNTPGKRFFITNSDAVNVAIIKVSGETGVTIPISSEMSVICTGVDYTKSTGIGVTDGDKGDITVSGTGTVWTIDNEAVTLAKQANMATASLVYRKTAGAGVPEVNTLATVKADLALGTTDSPIFVTTKLSALTDDYIPYHVDDATGLANGPTKTNVDSAISLKHTAGTDTALGAVGTKNPPIDGDKFLYRDSTAADVLVTSTGTQVKAYLKTYLDTLYSTIIAYRRTMAGDETLPYQAKVMVCNIDPDGAARNLDPDVAFPSGSLLVIINRGAYSIVFDSSGISQAIGSGQKETFIYDGTVWG